MRTRRATAAPRDRATGWSVALLLLLIAGVYFPVVGHGYVHWDDDVYVFENSRVLEGLSARSIAWAFGAFHESTWQPVTWLSFLTDATIFRADPRGYHLTNLILHAVSTLLLFWCLRRLLRPEAPGATALVAGTVIAALFAVHPLNVEPVAWIASRKDVLAGVFWYLTILGYLRAVERPSPRAWWTVHGLFALGLMSKPVVMTLPLLLLLLDRWPLRRKEPLGHRIREKAPLLALAAGSLVVTYLAQRAGGSVGSLEANSPAERLSYAATGYVLYLRDLVWPMRLAAFYPRNPIPAAWVAAAVLGLLSASILVVRERSRRPHLFTGWFWYLAALLPMSGLVPFGSHARADRFTYLPIVGISLAIVWSLRGLWPRRAARAAAAVVILLLAVLAGRQARFWRNDESLFAHARRVTTGNYLAEMKLGTALAYAGQPEAALAHFREVVRLRPRYLDGWYNLGTGLNVLKLRQESIEAYETGLKLKPDDDRLRTGLARTWNNFGVDAAGTGDFVEAERRFREALRIDPTNAGARTNLERARAALGAASDPAH